MRKKEFEKLKASLLERGYRVYNQKWHHEDYVIGKGFHRDDNKWEENRDAYCILLSIYDYSDKTEYWDRIPLEKRDYVGIGIRVDVSRTANERFEVITDWYDNTKIKDVEWVAEDFFRWIKSIYPEPREEQSDN